MCVAAVTCTRNSRKKLNMELTDLLVDDYVLQMTSSPNMEDQQAKYSRAANPQSPT